MAMTADNASSNDTQTDRLNALPNSFEAINRVRCFNHTLQLSVKALLRPFSADDDDKNDDTANDMPELEEICWAEEDEGEEGEESIDDEAEDDDDGDDNNDDPFSDLSEEERAELMDKTKEVRLVISK
ncbi:hypothetical protein H0H92_000756, partial [Tricholoma furcatifolium]